MLSSDPKETTRRLGLLGGMAKVRLGCPVGFWFLMTILSLETVWVVASYEYDQVVGYELT